MISNTLVLHENPYWKEAAAADPAEVLGLDKDKKKILY